MIELVAAAVPVAHQPAQFETLMAFGAGAVTLLLFVFAAAVSGLLLAIDRRLHARA